MRLEFSPESQLDLMEIAAFIAQDNPARAKSFVDELEADCGRLVTQPGIGAPRPELGDGVRVLPHGRYLIFYRPTEDVVRVALVLHSARDVGAAFSPLILRCRTAVAVRWRAVSPYSAFQ